MLRQFNLVSAICVQLLRQNARHYAVTMLFVAAIWALLSWYFSWLAGTTTFLCRRVEPTEITCDWFAKGATLDGPPTQSLQRLHYVEVQTITIETEDGAYDVYRAKLVSRNGTFLETPNTQAFLLAEQQVNAINAFIQDPTQSALQLEARLQLHYRNLIWFAMIVSVNLFLTFACVATIVGDFKDKYRTMHRQSAQRN